MGTLQVKTRHFKIMRAQRESRLFILCRWCFFLRISFINQL